METISFTHRVDAISQEIDETYTLTVNIQSGSFGANDKLITVLTVTIKDGDSKFTESVSTKTFNHDRYRCYFFIFGG